MKKYNNSNNDKLDNNIDRYDDDDDVDDNENDNYDNDNNKSRFQVKSARLHDFVCIVNIAIRITKFLFNYLLFLKLLFIPALKKLVLVTTYVTPTKLSQVFNGKDM